MTRDPQDPGDGGSASMGVWEGAIIPADVAKHAEQHECYCGSALLPGVVAVCSTCGAVPEKCTCPEQSDGA